MWRYIHAFLLLAAGACVCGCGPSGPERVAVTGTVTYQGKPIEQGSIRFVPTGETKGPATGTTIKQGKYEASAKGGVLVGTQRVEITAVAPRKDPMGRDLAVMEGAGIAGLKYALDLRGYYGGPARLPILPPDEKTKAELASQLKRLGII